MGIRDIGQLTTFWDDGERPPPLNKDHPWHAPTCPIIQTHQSSDCDCGGHTREMAYQRKQNAKKF